MCKGFRFIITSKVHKNRAKYSFLSYSIILFTTTKKLIQAVYSCISVLSKKKNGDVGSTGTAIFCYIAYLHIFTAYIYSSEQVQSPTTMSSAGLSGKA